MDVIDELIAHCEAWEPWARVMGNVCAGDAAQALRSLRAELAEAKRDAERDAERLLSQAADALERAPRWRDVVDELPTEAQEVLFVRGGKTVHGAWIGGIFWHNNQKMAASYWMPLPLPPNDRIQPRRYGGRRKVKHYGHFTPYELDAAINPLTGARGNYYCRHVSALTEESLHAKSEIAAELGWRDLQIDTLRAELAKADGQINRCVEQNKYLESTISRLREYARHKPCCPNGIFLAASCDCGYDALLAALEETK